MWGRVHETFDEMLYELEEEGCTDESMRSEQSRSVGNHLKFLFHAHAEDVLELLSVAT